MNKKLVAVAIAGLLAAPLVQAQTANVTLYGRLNMTMEMVNGKQATPPNTNNGSNPNVFRVSSNSSRIGFRGTESLGGGLSAIFQIESNVSSDGGNQTATTGNTLIPTTSTPAGLGTRETFVGLQGGWGTFKMGRFLAPYDDIHPIFGNVPTLTTSILNTAVLWGQGQVGQPENGGFDDRVRNSVRYDSPTIAGFNASVQYGSAEMAQLVPGNSATQQKSNAGVWSLGGYYNNGPWQGGIAYEQHNQIRGVGLNDKALSVAGGYQFTNFRIGAVWQELKYGVAPITGVTTNYTELKGDMWGVGTTINLGPGQFYAFYGKQLNSKGSAPQCTTLACVANANRYAGQYAAPRVGGLTAGPSSSAQQWEVSYTYPLSKRTLLQTGYVKIINESNAAYTFNINSYGICTNNGAACGSSGSPGGFVAGMVHFF